MHTLADRRAPSGRLVSSTFAVTLHLPVRFMRFPSPGASGEALVLSITAAITSDENERKRRGTPSRTNIRDAAFSCYSG